MPAKRRLPRKISGTCIAGTVDEPLRWYRNHDDGLVELYGRVNPNPGNPQAEFICSLRQNDPVAVCRPCVAYRYLKGGVDGMNKVTREPTTLTGKEHDLRDEDPDAYYAYKDHEGRSVSTLARWYPHSRDISDEVREYQLAAVRRWRASHPGSDQRKRKRDRAAYMREYRKRNPVRTIPLARDRQVENIF